MSTSVPPRDGSARAGSASSFTPFLSDEQTLRRVFDANFNAYIESARGTLGDAAGQAPRVVEAAFVNAWKQRESLANDEQVKAFLTEEVGHGATRALSRRAAAHRFGTRGRDSGATDMHARAPARLTRKPGGPDTHAIHDTAEEQSPMRRGGCFDTAAAHMKSGGRKTNVSAHRNRCPASLSAARSTWPTRRRRCGRRPQSVRSLSPSRPAGPDRHHDAGDGSKWHRPEREFLPDGLTKIARSALKGRRSRSCAGPGTSVPRGG